jgi:hypothetical protein
MSLDTLITDTRTAITDDAANAQAVFAAEGTLVGVTEVDIRTGAHTFKVDEPAAAVDQHCPVLDLFQNPVPVTRSLFTSG